MDYQADEASIDAFQRQILKCYVLNIKWPQKIRTIDIYKQTGQKPWSRIIAHRRLSWFSHLARLPENTPAKRALRFALKPVRLPRGKPKITWITIIKKQLKEELWIPSILTALKKAQNREQWSSLVNRKCAV